MRCSKISSTNTYQDLAEHCFGKRGLIFISIFQFLFAFGGMCAYVVIVGDTVPIVLRQLTGVDQQHMSPVVRFLTSRRFITAVTTLGVSLPLSLYRDITKLAKASAFALLALVFIFIAMLVQGPAEYRNNPVEVEYAAFKPSFIRAIGVISFAFVCHHNSFLIFGSLRRPSIDNQYAVTYWSTGISCAFSLALGVVGYSFFGPLTHANILNNFAHDSALMNVARLAFAMNMFTTFPLECFVCREVVEVYFFPGQRIPYRLHVAITVCLTTMTLALALVTCDLGVVLELTGCFAAAALAFILPPACYLQLLRRKQQDDGTNRSGKFGWLNARTLMPALCVLAGVLVMLISTAVTIQSAITEPNQKNCYW